MDLYEIESRANQILDSTEILYNQYQNIVVKLLNIYDLIAKTNSPQARDLKLLIDKYGIAIQSLGKYYGEGASEIISYVNATNENLMQFTANIKASIKVYNDMLVSIER